MAEKLNSIFSYQFDAIIWKYLVDIDSNKIAVELRSHSQMSLQFAICDIVTSEVKYLTSDFDWWTSIEAFKGEYLYLKQYESDNNPDVKSFIEFHIPSSEFKTYPNEDIIPETQNDLLRPALYPATNEHYQLILDFIKDRTKEDANAAGIEFLDWNENVCVSYYVGKPKMANYLLVVDKEKKNLLHECIDNNLEGIGQDTFTIANNKLIFVKGKKELNIYQINEDA